MIQLKMVLISQSHIQHFKLKASKQTQRFIIQVDLSELESKAFGYRQYGIKILKPKFIHGLF